MMFSPSQSIDTPVIATLGHSPRYAGSFHDADTARQLGYRDALIPGAFLYGYMSRQAVAEWGIDWLRRGTIEARFTRPVYDGAKLIVRAGPLQATPQARTVTMSVLDEAGNSVATGAVGMPNADPLLPDLAAFPVFPLDGPVAAVGAGELPEGFALRTRNNVVAPEAHRQSMDDFGETHPLYRQDGILHPGLLLRSCIGDANSSRVFPTPVILVAAAARHLGVARAGDRLSMSGRVAAVYERKGNHYFDSDELLIANVTTPIAWFRRTSIYAARAKTAAT